MIAALLKGTRHYEERDFAPARDVLLLSILNTGADLTVSACPEIFEVAVEIDPLTPVAVGLTVESTLYHGSSARLRATKIEVGDGDCRQVAVDPEIDDSAKAVRKQLRDYSKRISS